MLKDSPTGTTWEAALSDAVQLVTPEYWDEARKYLTRRDRVMKRLIPQFGTACLRRARCIHRWRAASWPADLGEGRAERVGALFRCPSA